MSRPPSNAPITAVGSNSSVKNVSEDKESPDARQALRQFVKPR